MMTYNGFLTNTADSIRKNLMTGFNMLALLHTKPNFSALSLQTDTSTDAHHPGY